MRELLCASTISPPRTNSTGHTLFSIMIMFLVLDYEGVVSGNYGFREEKKKKSFDLDG